MDHIICLDAKSGEMENLILGNKSMIIRGATGKQLPHGRVSAGDMLYFVNNDCKGEILARGIVTSVFCYGMLTREESFEIIIRNQDKLQLPDKQFESIAGNRYLVLIGVDKIEEITPLRLKNSSISHLDDCLSMGKIDEYILTGRGIIPA